MNLKTTHKLLGAMGSHPTTPAGIDKRLEAIAAGRGLHRPTMAHPYRDCFASTDRFGSTRRHRHSEQVPMQFEGREYMRAMTCEEYIRAMESCTHDELVQHEASRWEDAQSYCPTCKRVWAQRGTRLSA